MVQGLNQGNAYTVFRDFYHDKDNYVKGENDLFRHGVKNDIEMFSRGTAKDGRKWIADDGFILVEEKDGKLNKVKKLEFDKDGDGIADEYYKVKSLQNGKVKAHKLKYNSQYINSQIAELSAITDPVVKAEKLLKLKNKLLEAGISQEIIDKKFEPPKPKISYEPPKKEVKTANTPQVQIPQDEISEYREQRKREYKDMTPPELLVASKKQQSRARAMLLDKGVQNYLQSLEKRDPELKKTIEERLIAIIG